MPTYPTTLPINQRESRRIPRDGREEDVIGDGIIRVRKLHPDRSDFEIMHPQISTANLATLSTFYNANLTTAFDFVWPEDGVTYSVRFGKGGLRTRFVSAAWRDAYVRLVAAA